MTREIEAKIRVPDLQPLRQRLAALGADDLGMHREKNWVLDDQAGSLRQREMLLRVRSVGGPGGVLTVKRPVEDGEFKTREEVECGVDSAATLLAQLQFLGYAVNWIYEKNRHEWRWRDCAVALDECPEIGCFIEIEGEPANIRAVCADLRLDPAAHLGDNYLKLWMKHLETLGDPKRDMLFDSGRNTQT